MLKGEVYDEKCDVYSFGMCLLAMASPNPDFIGFVGDEYLEFIDHREPLSGVKLINALTSGEFRPGIPSSTPKTIGHMIGFSMNPDPTRRPSMSDLLQFMVRDVNKELEGGSFSRYPPSEDADDDVNDERHFKMKNAQKVILNMGPGPRAGHSYWLARAARACTRLRRDCRCVPSLRSQIKPV